MESHGMEALIPPEKNRIRQCRHGRSLHKSRHSLENAFLKLKGWREISAFRPNKKDAASHPATVRIRHPYLCLIIA
jgi:hypothetical protein